MTGSDPTMSRRSEEPAPAPEQEPDTSQSAGEPGYLTETGQAVGEDGSVVPIIGGLPAAEGSAWDIGASASSMSQAATSQSRMKTRLSGSC